MSFHQFLKASLPEETIQEFYTADSRDRLVALTAHEQRFLHALVGHLPFSYFSSFRLDKPATHFTILRDPLERIRSFYQYILNRHDHYLHAKLVTERISLAEFVEGKLTLECDNLQVRYLCSSDLSGVAIGSCTRQMLAEAKENLSESFKLFGLTEHFEETLAMCEKTLNWRDFATPRVNARHGPPPALERNAAAAIESMNELDTELYQFARQLFFRRLKQESN